MPYVIRERYYAGILTIRGRFLGSLERSDMERTVSDLLHQGKTRLIVDFSETDFIDSTGIGLLISAATRLRGVGGDVRLAGVEDRVRGVFVTSRLLGQVFEDYPTTNEALESYQLQHAG